MNDPQFSDYQFISINDNFELNQIYPSRIFESNCGSIIFLNGIEDYLYNTPKKLDQF